MAAQRKRPSAAERAAWDEKIRAEARAARFKPFTESQLRALLAAGGIEIPTKEPAASKLLARVAAKLGCIGAATRISQLLRDESQPSADERRHRSVASAMRTALDRLGVTRSRDGGVCSEPAAGGRWEYDPKAWLLYETQEPPATHDLSPSEIAAADRFHDFDGLPEMLINLRDLAERKADASSARKLPAGNRGRRSPDDSLRLAVKALAALYVSLSERRFGFSLNRNQRTGSHVHGGPGPRFVQAALRAFGIRKSLDSIRAAWRNQRKDFSGSAIH